MKVKGLAIYALVLLLVFGSVLIPSCSEKTEIQEQIIEDVTAEEAFNLIRENKDDPHFIILDVRTPQEFADGHIEDAINIDFNSNAFSDEINKLDKDKKYRVYCRTGNRSSGAVDEMTKLGLGEIYHLYEGIVGWSTAGYPLVK